MSERWIRPIAALRRRPDGRFEIVARWLFAESDGDKVEKPETMPHPKDSFQVLVTRLPDKHFLQADHSWGASEYWFPVRPRLKFMFDPPRVAVGDGTSADPRPWFVATAPETEVDCATDLQLPNGTDPRGSVGICHILREAHPSRSRFRVASLLQERLSQIAQRIGSAVVDTSQAKVGLAIELAAYVCSDGVRPTDLPAVMATELGRLRNGESPALLAGGLDDRKAALDRAVLVANVFGDAQFLNQLERLTEPPKRAREQLRLSAVSGGNLIDFWHDDAASRGAQSPASEVMGTGLTVGEFAEDEVATWKNLLVTVKGTAGPGPQVSELDEPLDPSSGGYLTTARTEYREGEAAISKAGLKRAMTDGSSHRPPAPLSARVNWDLVQTNSGNDGSSKDDAAPGATVGYATGDGRVELLIEPASTAGRTVFAYNVYAAWECDETKDWFSNPTGLQVGPREPKLEELQPWLITRRYSFPLDLARSLAVGDEWSDGLKKALQDPPWNPAFDRPTTIQDKTDGEGTTLPNAAYAGRLPFAFDLRTGMGADRHAGRLVGWDPRGPVDTKWTPELDRDGATRAHPQRYRFWVASVDMFEQISELKPVVASDADAGEDPDFRFRPLRRAPLEAPPGGSDPENPLYWIKRVPAELDQAATELHIRWETPYLNSTSTFQAPDAPSRTRADAHDLVGYVRVYRRTLRAAVLGQNDKRTLGLYRTGDVSSLPQWQRAAEYLAGLNYVEWGTLIKIEPPVSGDVWETRLSLTHADRGYEYVAVVGASVKRERQRFWTKNAVPTAGMGRGLRLTERDADGKFVERVVRTAETPSTSDVVITEMLAIENRSEPRAATLKSADLRPASPVLPPPRVYRDAVLARLASSAFDKAPSVWGDTGFSLTPGQGALATTAMIRAAKSMSIPADEVHAHCDLKDARRLLASEFVPARADQGQRRLHSTVGFRGFLDLNFHYDPLELVAPAENEAEAVLWRLVHTRVPLSPTAAKQFETFSIGATKAHERIYAVGELPLGPSAQLKSEQPLMVRVEPKDSGDASTFGVVSRVYVTEGVTYVELAGGDTEQMPASAVLRFYAPQPLLERRARRLSAERLEQRLLVPVGGGHAEIGCWWLVGVSAETRQTGRARTAFTIKELPASVEPVGPSELLVLPATDTLTHRLDPKDDAERPWLPVEAQQNAGVAEGGPRALVLWSGAAGSGDHVGIEREQLRVTQEESSLRSLKATRTSWEVVSEIERWPADKPLVAADMEILQRDWLLGKPTEAPDSLSDKPPELIPARRHLPASRGIKPLRVTVDGRQRTLPSFVDYHRDAEDNTYAMDGNWKYRYRLKTYTDLDPTGSLPDAVRYLASRPTPWSSFFFPGSPPLLLQEKGDPELRKTDDPFPSVAFSFGSPMRSAQDLYADARWVYRLWVQRRLTASVTADPALDAADIWIDVGAPTELVPGGGPVEIVDNEVDRPSAEAAPRLEYRVFAQHVQIHKVDGRWVEEPVRGHEEPHDLTVRLPLPAHPATEEVIVTRRFTVT